MQPESLKIELILHTISPPQGMVPEQFFCLLVYSTKQTKFINHTD